VRITISLSKEMYEKVKEIIAQRYLKGERVSFAQIVREALEHYIEESGELVKITTGEVVKSPQKESGEVMNLTTGETVKRLNGEAVKFTTGEVSGISKKEVEESHESIQSPIKGMEEALKGISDVIVEVSEIIEKEEKEGVSAEEEEKKEERPATIGDAIIMLLTERAREPKELLKMLIDMGFPPRESEKTIEELIKKGVIEVCEVEMGKWGKQSFLRLKEKEEEVKEE